MAVSPGVFTKIIDLSAFVEAVPSTIGFMCILSRKGEDNTLKFIGSRSEFVSEFGEPNINDFGSSFSQGPYIAYNFLGESGSLYVIRCLPEDAAFSNIRINALERTSSDYDISVDYLSQVNSLSEIETNLVTDGTNVPVCILYPIGRGDYYNAIGIRFTEHANPLISGVYTLDIYERQSDGDDVIIESFEISFDREALDDAGDSLFIEDVLETYSTFLRAKVGDDGHEIIGRVYDREVGSVSIDLTPATASLTDLRQDFIDWETDPETTTAEYMVIVKDQRGNTLYGWLGAATGNGNTVNVFAGKNLGSVPRGWIEKEAGDLANFDDTAGTITYEIKKTQSSVATAFQGSEPVPMRRGSLGSLLLANGSLDTSEAITVLAQGYRGALVSKDDPTELADIGVYDTENIYFNIIFDAGYPADVKVWVSQLAQTRRDSVAILDNGDNATFSASIATRNTVNTFNNYFTALYEPYNKVFDPFTGRDIFFSPLYHMSYIIPRNDNVAEVWFAPAGFNRAAIDSIKELRFNPTLSQRDQLYLKRLNPIVKFNEGYTVWGQLTSQAKASALTDLNIVRLVLFAKQAIERFARFYIFEQNDSITWSAVEDEVVNFLEELRRRRGLDSFSVEVSATDYEKKRKQFHINVILQPTRAVEQILLNFFVV